MQSINNASFQAFKENRKMTRGKIDLEEALKNNREKIKEIKDLLEEAEDAIEYVEENKE